MLSRTSFFARRSQQASVFTRQLSSVSDEEISNNLLRIEQKLVGIAQNICGHQDLLNGINYKIEALHGSTRSRNKKIQKSMVNFGVPTNLENLICEYSELPPNPSIIEIIDQLKCNRSKNPIL